MFKIMTPAIVATMVLGAGSYASAMPMQAPTLRSPPVVLQVSDHAHRHGASSMEHSKMRSRRGHSMQNMGKGGHMGGMKGMDHGRM